MSTNSQVTLFREKAYDRLLAEISSKDDLAVKLGDTLDVKASILLLVITFLATQTAYFLDKSPTALPHHLLVCSGMLLGCATIAALVELWPRTYMLPLPEKSGVERAAELRDFYGQHEGVEAGVMVAEFTKNQMGWAQSRIASNQAINRNKSKCLEWSFYFTAIAMLLNMVTLLIRLF